MLKQILEEFPPKKRKEDKEETQTLQYLVDRYPDTHTNARAGILLKESFSIFAVF